MDFEYTDGNPDDHKSDKNESESVEENGKFLNPTPMLDELEEGPWPSFISGLKELAERTEKPMLRGVMDQLEYSYQTKMGYWKGDSTTESESPENKSTRTGFES